MAISQAQLRQLVSGSVLAPDGRQHDPSKGSIVSMTVPVLVVNAEDEPRVPRPMNAFMLFRQQVQTQVREQHPSLDNCHVSKVVGELWKTLPSEKRQAFHARAASIKREHEAKHPNWRFKPKRSKRPSAAEFECLITFLKSLPSDLVDRIRRTEKMEDLCRKDQEDTAKAAAAAYSLLKGE